MPIVYASPQFCSMTGGSPTPCPPFRHQHVGCFPDCPVTATRRWHIMTLSSICRILSEGSGGTELQVPARTRHLQAVGECAQPSN